MLSLACALSYTRAHAAAPATPAGVTAVQADPAEAARAKTMTPEQLVAGLSDRVVGRRLAYHDEILARGAGGVPALVAGMRNRHHRQRLLELIVKIGVPALRPLLSLLNDPVLGPQAGTALALTATPAAQSLIPDFMRCLKIENTRNACGTALARAARGAKSHRAEIVAAAKDSNAEVRMFVCVALGETGGRESVPALKGALSDSAPAVRAAAAHALGRIGRDAAAAQEALKAGAKDADPEVRHAAKEALKRVRG